MAQRSITLGHPEAHEKLTARLFWKLVGASGYNDAGNVRDYVDATTRSLVTRARASDGARFVNDEQADVNHEAWTFLLDERVPEQEKILKLAQRNTDQAQAAGEGQTASITNTQEGKWYAIGAYNIANVQVSGSLSGPLEEGTDYELDEENGRIRVITDGLTTNGETLNLTFDQPAITLESFLTQQAPLWYCDIMIEEHNQYSQMWLRRMSFKGYLNVMEFPQQTGEFGTYRVKVTPAEPVTVLKRPDGQNLPTHGTESEGPGKSSSSSSNSSATSSQSQSNSSASS